MSECVRRETTSALLMKVVSIKWKCQLMISAGKKVGHLPLLLILQLNSYVTVMSWWKDKKGSGRSCDVFAPSRSSVMFYYSWRLFCSGALMCEQVVIVCVHLWIVLRWWTQQDSGEVGFCLFVHVETTACELCLDLLTLTRDNKYLYFMYMFDKWTLVFFFYH